MRYLADIDSAGGRSELDGILDAFVIDGDEEAKNFLLSAIDLEGLRSNATMMAVSSLQRQLAVKPTLYSQLRQLAEKYNLEPQTPQSVQTSEETAKPRTMSLWPHPLRRSPSPLRRRRRL